MNRLARLEKARLHMDQEGFDALLITHLPNLYYLSGFRGSDGAILLTKTHQILLVDGRYGTQARMQAPQFETIVYPEKVFGIAGEMKKEQLKSVGFESRSMTFELHAALVNALPKVSLKAIGNWV